jgi:hypothetical protein
MVTTLIERIGREFDAPVQASRILKCFARSEKVAEIAEGEGRHFC